MQLSDPNRKSRTPAIGRNAVGARITGCVLVLLLLVLPLFGQARLGSAPHRNADPNFKGEFTFVRTIYSSPYSRWGGSWRTDFPEADYHFIIGVRDWAGTNLGISSEPEQITILDERLFDYPLIYFVEPGYMELSSEDATRLREYSDRGGFLFLDDFWGEYEWENVQEQMNKIFPGQQIADLPLNHSIFHTYFDIEQVVQVPGIHSWMRGVTYEKGGYVPHYMGIQDKTGRVRVFIARNCDLGDAWEWIDRPEYPIKYGLAAYKVGINVIIYAMTH
ncbi:MAG TPA: DUF4159 domain-containing protein [Blastocatellia bacterium]|nr:DUF4159 domain-containing protein [Blastocatellia bacterium]